MLGGQLYGLPKSQIKTLERTRSPCASFRLVGDENYGFVRPANQIGEETVGGSQSGTRVEDEENRIGKGERSFGLHAHPSRQRGAVPFFQSGGVDYLKGEVAK